MAVKNNQMMMHYIKQDDRQLLPHLTNVVTRETSEPTKEIFVELTFSENDWFTNQKLTLLVKFKKDEDDEVQETEGCLIDWKDGKDLTKKKIKKKQKNKKTGETRTIVKTVPNESFFNVFESRKAPEKDDGDDSDQDEEREKLLDALDESMQAAMDFNDLYNVEALEYYLNFGQDPNDLMGLGGEDSDDDNDDDDDEDSGKSKKKEKKKDTPAAGGDGKEQECKQQ